MPSLTHEALLLLFRNRPELAPELLREALGIELPAYTEVRVESADLTEVVPAEYRADLVVLLVDGKPVLAIAVEVQLARDDRKRFTWPVYAAGLYARFECPAVVLVVTPAPEVARWAAEPIRLGPVSSFSALVLGPDAVPVVTDPARAEADPELGVLSAMAHGRGNVEQAVQIALAAIAGAKLVQDRDVSVLYFDLIDAALSEAARKAFQMLPQGYEFQSETLRKNVATTKAAAVVAVLEAREIALSEEQKNRILTCLDIKLLDQWIRRAAIIGSADELFSA
jgi:hypothetical protein